MSGNGEKYDDKKLDLTLVPPEMEEMVADVMMFGAAKYARNNWKIVEDADRRYFAAMERHIKAFKRGEDTDHESGLHHLAHAATCMAFLLHFLADGPIGAWRAVETVKEKLVD